MKYTIKILSVYIAIIVAGGVFLSSVSADDSAQTATTEVESTSSTVSSGSVSSDTSSDDGTGETVDTESDDSSVSSTGAISVENTEKMQNLHRQCESYVKEKNLTGVDCDAKIKDARKKMKNERALLEQKLKEERKGLEQKNKEQRMEFNDRAKEQRKEMQAKKKALSDKLHGQLIKAIEKLPQTKLEKVLSNIDKAVTKVSSSTLDQTKKDRFLAQLEEIKVIIQEKIDALTGNASEELNLGELLEGTTDAVTQ